MSYRSFYKTTNSPVNKTSLEHELQNLQEELRVIQTRSVPHRQYSPINDVSYKNICLILTGGILLGCFSLLIWMAGRKSGKDIYKYKHRC